MWLLMSPSRIPIPQIGQFTVPGLWFCPEPGSAAGAPASAPSSERSTTSADPSPPSQSDSLTASSSPCVRHEAGDCGLSPPPPSSSSSSPISSPISCSPCPSSCLPLSRSPLPSPSPASDGPPRTAAWSVRVRVGPRPPRPSRSTGSSWSMGPSPGPAVSSSPGPRPPARSDGSSASRPRAAGRPAPLVRLRSRPAPRFSHSTRRRPPALLRARLAFSGRRGRDGRCRAVPDSGARQEFAPRGLVRSDHRFQGVVRAQVGLVSGGAAGWALLLELERAPDAERAICDAAGGGREGRGVGEVDMPGPGRGIRARGTAIDAGLGTGRFRTTHRCACTWRS